jgi:hypothetical protein
VVGRHTVDGAVAAAAECRSSFGSALRSCRGGAGADSRWPHAVRSDPHAAGAGYADVVRAALHAAGAGYADVVRAAL